MPAQHVPSITNQVLHRLFNIHDMLPHRAGVPGLEASEIHQRLNAEGIRVNLRTVQHDLLLIQQLLYIKVERNQGSSYRYKRLHRKPLLGTMRCFAESRVPHRNSPSEPMELYQALCNSWQSGSNRRIDSDESEQGEGSATDLPDFPSNIEV